MMTAKQFSSFKEINQELQVLKLQRQINAEHIKLTMEKVRGNLHPTSLLGGITGLAKTFLFSVLLKKVVQRLR
jgi:hypothetical protein